MPPIIRRPANGSEDIENALEETREASRLQQVTSSFRNAFLEKNVAVIEALDNPTEDMDHLRYNMGLYKEYALAESMVEGEKIR